MNKNDYFKDLKFFKLQLWECCDELKIPFDAANMKNNCAAIIEAAALRTDYNQYASEAKRLLVDFEYAAEKYGKLSGA